MQIKIKKLHENAHPPYRATQGSAGADLFALLNDDIVLKPGERKLIPTGLALEIPEGYCGFIFNRSSMGLKHGVSLANSVGVIDSDYRGEVGVVLINHSQQNFTVKNNDRIAQLVIMPVCGATFITCENLSETERGSGGFGSTNVISN